MNQKLEQILLESVKAHQAISGKAGLGSEAGEGSEWRARLSGILADACPRIPREPDFPWVKGPEDLWEDTILHFILRSLGCSAMEALRVLLEIAAPLDRAPTLATFMAPRSNPVNLLPLMDHHGIHPLSVARQFCHRAEALGFLEALGLGKTFGAWIGPGGRLLIQGDTKVRALPAGLLLRGNDRIEDCPRLVDLGQGLVSLIGPLWIARCDRLEQLPDGFETWPMRPIAVDGIPRGPGQECSLQVQIKGCPNFKRLGHPTLIQGILRLVDCPSFQATEHPGVDRIEQRHSRRRNPSKEIPHG